MKRALPALTLAAAAILVGGGYAAGHSQSTHPQLVSHSVAQPLVTVPLLSTAAANGSTITVIGNGTVSGTPDEGTMSFSVSVNAGSAASALSGESSRAQKLIDALKSAGVSENDIQTEWVSLYRNEQTGEFTASSSVSAKIHGISHIGSTIDAAVGAAGDSVSFGGVSLSIGDTSGLMGTARGNAVRDAQSKAQQYAQAAGLKLGGIVSISEVDNTPRPIVYGGAMQATALAGSAAQPIQPGQQQLEVSVTVVFALA